MGSNSSHVPPSPPTRSVRLVPDVLTIIFNTFQLKRDFSQCALVCREWREPVQRALFFNLFLDNQKVDKYDLVADVAILLASPRLCSYVRRVNAVLSSVELLMLGAMLPGLKTLCVMDHFFFEDALPAMRGLVARLEYFFFEPRCTLLQMVTVNGGTFAHIIGGGKQLKQLTLRGLIFEPETLTNAPRTVLPALESVYVTSGALRDEELRWLISLNNDSLKKVQYTAYSAPHPVEILSKQSDIRQLPQPPAVTEAGLIRALSRAKQLGSLWIPYAKLTPAGLIELLDNLPCLFELSIPLEAIGKEGLRSASANLTQIDLIPSHATPNQSTLDVLKHLEYCALARVEHIKLVMHPQEWRNWQRIGYELREIVRMRDIAFTPAFSLDI